jgi:hypothetical protein
MEVLPRLIEREREERFLLSSKRRWWEDEERDHVDGNKLTSKITLNEYKYIENRRAI